MGYKRTRLFGKKRFTVFAFYDRKTEAEDAAAKLRSKGAKTRRVYSKSERGYVLYVHGGKL